jgi:hypothetical protein
MKNVRRTLLIVCCLFGAANVVVLSTFVTTAQAVPQDP